MQKVKMIVNKYFTSFKDNKIEHQNNVIHQLELDNKKKLV